MHRRAFLQAGAALAATQLPWPLALQAMPVKRLGEPTAFDFAILKGRARALAERPYGSRKSGLPEEILALDYDQWQAIRFRDDHFLWDEAGKRFYAAFFHLGLFFKSPVHIHELVDGRAQELAYDPAMFDYGKSGLDGKSLPRDLGFAGFRLGFHTDRTRDVAAFLGASYFRAVGADWQYGLSARGLAIDCGMPRDEEFPDFVAFWLERPAPNSSTLTVYALLDSPSVAGAYRFDITPGGNLLMDVDAALYPRKAIERLGIAPLTSMFQMGENDRRMANDWRPEIHDSDGLSMWTGAGEWLWRPLVNPRNSRFNVYIDDSPRGFGLMQRDREFAHYQDDAVWYERRPSLWVEPRGSWGPGSVQLLELPTRDETFDNIVAFWCPQAPPEPGKELLFSYRLHWGTRAAAAPKLAQVIATRTGVGGVVGQKREKFSWRFAVDFAGGDFSMLGRNVKVEPVISASRGTVEITSAWPQEAIRGYRARFDIVPPDESQEPIDLRLFLTVNGQPLSETWLYQWTPPPPAERAAYL